MQDSVSPAETETWALLVIYLIVLIPRRSEEEAANAGVHCTDAEYSPDDATVTFSLIAMAAYMAGPGSLTSCFLI